MLVIIIHLNTKWYKHKIRCYDYTGWKLKSNFPSSSTSIFEFNPHITHYVKTAGAIFFVLDIMKSLNS